jgi:hypothetical protein
MPPGRNGFWRVDPNVRWLAVLGARFMEREVRADALSSSDVVFST